MKLILTQSWCILSALLLTWNIQAQNWSNPTPITDSLSINSNPSGWLIGYSSYGVFYEKRACDTCKPAVWYRNLTQMDPEKYIISTEAGCYTPLFFDIYSNENLGFLLYLSDSMGTKQIFASLIDNDFHAGTPTQLTFGTKEISSLVLKSSYNNQFIGWITDSSAWVANLQVTNNVISLSDSTLLDSTSVTDFKLGWEVAYIQRLVNNLHQIYHRQRMYDFNTGEYYWGETLALDTIGDNIQMAVSDGFSYMGSPNVVWTKENQLFVGAPDSWWGGPVANINTGGLPFVQHPGLVSWDIPVKEEFWEPHIAVFSSDTGNNSEIYASTLQYIYTKEVDTLNITNNNVADRNPALFWGEDTYPMSNWVYAVWESHRNANVPLYFSKTKAFIGSDIEEINAGNSLFMQVLPNPFTEQLTINLKSTLNSPINLIIYSLLGKAIWDKQTQPQNQEIQNIIWKPQHILPKGIYLLIAEQEGKKISQRIVYQ